MSLFYRLAPRRPTRFAEVWVAALSATVLLRAAESVFVIYLKDFARLNLVYGAFGGIMALLLWIYVYGCVFVFGACLCAARTEALGKWEGTTGLSRGDGRKGILLGNRDRQDALKKSNLYRKQQFKPIESSRC